MSIPTQITKGAAAIAAAAMLISSIGPAAAISLPDASPQAAGAAAPIEKVWCNWGCGPGPVVGGFVAGAIVGAAVAGAARPAPVYYGPPPGYYGPCWRRVIGPYGGVHWQRVC